MKGPRLSFLLILTRRWRVFALSSAATICAFLLAYWAQPIRYRVYGVYSPHQLERRAGVSPPPVAVEAPPNFLVRLTNLLTLQGNKLSPEAKFIRNDDLLRDVIQALEIKDFGGNPASPRSLRRRITLSSANQGEAVKIALHDKDPNVAVQVVDQLMQRYVEYFAAQTPAESVSFNSVIQPQLVSADTLSKQTRQAIYQIQVGSRQTAVDTAIRAGDQTLELQAIGISAQQQLSTIEADLNQLRQILRDAVGDQRSLVQQVIQLGETRQKLLNQLQATLNQARDSETISADLQALETQGLNLQRELTITQTQYNKFLGGEKTPWAVSQSTQNSAAIVAPAALPTNGYRPYFPWFLGAGIVSGCLVGGLMAQRRERQDQSLSTLSQIYWTTQLPIFGVLPTFSHQNLSVQLLARQEGTEFQEFSTMMGGYLQALQQMSRASLDRIPQVLAFTSMTQGEGKSLTTANLAYLLSKQGKKVLVLEADLIHPGQFQLWDIARAAGLCDCMAGEIQLGKALQRLQPDLDLLQAGYPNKNPDILLNSPGLSLLIRELRTRYDHILVDSPSLDQSVHGYLLANSTDATVLLLRPGYVDRKDIEHLREVLGRSGTRLWGMIINATKFAGAFGTGVLMKESQWDANLRLQKPRNLSGVELSTLSAINPPGDSGELSDPFDQTLSFADRTRRQQQEEYLYRLPLDEVKKLVEVLWEDWSHDIELLLEQEEEVVQQSRMVRDLRNQAEHGNPYLKLGSELDLKDEQEKLNVLAEAYVGQRKALIEEKEDLKFYLSILYARTDAEKVLPIESTLGASRRHEFN